MLHRYYIRTNKYGRIVIKLGYDWSVDGYDGVAGLYQVEKHTSLTFSQEHDFQLRA